MQSKILAGFNAAVADVHDGATILIAGFGPGTPWNLIRALYQQGAKDLTLAFNIANRVSREDAVGIGDLVNAGRVRKVIAAFTAATHPSQENPIEQLCESDAIEWEITPQGTLAERIRAGGAGIPAFYTPAGVGTVVAEGKEHRAFGGREYLLEEAITGDFAFLRAWKADSFGNLVFRRAQRNFNPIMATAARCSIAEIEEPIVNEGELDPDLIHTSCIYINRMIQIGAGDIMHMARAALASRGQG
ncbi:MAG TPA: CoA transferase subunit A [Dehalococcoidia bacterium]|nr:CoA transferase subunit A [Dehalococcoidia bacterium]